MDLKCLLKKSKRRKIKKQFTYKDCNFNFTRFPVGNTEYKTTAVASKGLWKYIHSKNFVLSQTANY